MGDAVARPVIGVTVKPSILLSTVLAAAALAVPALSVRAAKPVVCAQCVKANMQRLAGDELHGRGCGTEDEHVAAHFVAETLKRYGVAPGAGVDSYLQPVQLSTPTAAAPPTLRFSAGASQVALTQGQDMVALEPPPSLEAPFVRLTDAHVASILLGALAYLLLRGRSWPSW